MQCRTRTHGQQNIRSSTVLNYIGQTGSSLQVKCQPAQRTVTYREYYTRCCINTIRPPNDEHSVARNM